LELVLRKILRDYGFLLTLAALVIALDQYTKMLVRTNLALEEYWSPWPWLEPYVRIVHWKNTGAAFGMLQGFGDVFTVLAFLVAIAIIYYFPQVPRGDWVLRLAMGLQLGGALGNLIDRLVQGHVTDFISVGTFPVFNVADASISTGVAVLVLGMWFRERKSEQSEPVSHGERSEPGETGAPDAPGAHVATGEPDQDSLAESGSSGAYAATDAHLATGSEEAKGE
jgi:signal peptidase II